MKSFFPLTAVLFCSAASFAQGIYPYDLRSDTLHVYHYDIHLDFSDFSSAKLEGRTRAYFTPLSQPVSSVTLDLLGPDVDSIMGENGQHLVFSSTNENFTAFLPSPLSIADSSYFDVYYHGTPVTDNQFGGFYYNSTYAYNVGVSLSDIPHNYGKTWFPCQDNFVNRSTYDTYITTPPGYKSACGGVLAGTTINPDLTQTQHWKIEQTIPSYLASAAVSTYAYVNKTFSGINGPMPVQIAVRPADSTAVKNSFINLENAFDIYEAAYGPYKWDRVGYAITPMSGGAMEHAMNIAYPRSLANGPTTYQSVMAHELSHHWWGNLVTCKTAEDMWINEGSASYSEYVFTEEMSGRSAYEIEIRNNHKSLLQSCHIDDDGYWPLSGMPQAHTYGTTTYSKGADFIHTLRSYLGDNLFFSGLQQLLLQNEFSDIDAVEYRNELSAITGVDLTNFFNDWIFQGGWPHIAVDSLDVTPSGLNYNVNVFLHQKLTGRSAYSTHVPVTVTFRGANWETYKTKIYSEGQQNMVAVSVPFNPVMAYLNDDELISHAVTADYKVVNATGTNQLYHSNFTLNTISVTDSVFVLVEHNWTAPDPIVNNLHQYTISPQRYWRVDGMFPASYNAKATLRYTSDLDNLLITQSEDSLILLYRRNCSLDWTEYDDYTKLMGNVNDKTGSVVANNLRKGEYAFGMKGLPLGISESKKVTSELYPNPVDKSVKISCNKTMEVITITSLNGQLLGQYKAGDTFLEIDLSGLPSGTYLVSAYTDKEKLFTRQLVVN